MFRPFIHTIIAFLAVVAAPELSAQTAALPASAPPEGSPGIQSPKRVIDVNVPSSAIGAQETWQEEAKRKEEDLAKQQAEVVYRKAEDEILEDRRMRLYKKTVDIYPGHYEALFKLGWHLQKMNLRKMSAEYYERCLKVKPDHYAALNNLGNIYKDWHDYTRASYLYRESMKANPRYPLARLNMGNLFRERKQYDDAQRYYNETLNLDPYNFWANLNSAAVILRRLPPNDPERGTALRLAEKRLLNALRKRSRILAVQDQMGLLRELQGNLAGAKKHYSEALRLVPRHKYSLQRRMKAKIDSIDRRISARRHDIKLNVDITGTGASDGATGPNKNDTADETETLRWSN